MIRCSFGDFGKCLNKWNESLQKAARLSIYQTLETLAEGSRAKIIQSYPQIFKDENGVRKNRGVPKMTTKSKVDKQAMSITLGWAMRKDIDFMDDQEFGGVRGEVKAKAQPTWITQQQGRTNTGKMKAALSVKQLMNNIMQHENQYSKETGKPKPFIMQTRSGHHMIARRRTKARDSYDVLYHFDKKVRIRKRWNFVETVDNFVIHYKEPLFTKKLEKNLEKAESKLKFI